MITPQNLEKVLVELPMVREVCVIPASDEDSEYRYHAFIVLEENSPGVLYDFQTASAELLEGIHTRAVVLPELPKSAMGHIYRNALRDLCAPVDV